MTIPPTADVEIFGSCVNSEEPYILSDAVSTILSPQFLSPDGDRMCYTSAVFTELPSDAYDYLVVRFGTRPSSQSRAIETSLPRPGPLQLGLQFPDASSAWADITARELLSYPGFSGRISSIELPEGDMFDTRMLTTTSASLPFPGVTSVFIKGPPARSFLRYLALRPARHFFIDLEFLTIEEVELRPLLDVDDEALLNAMTDKYFYNDTRKTMLSCLNSALQTRAGEQKSLTRLRIMNGDFGEGVVETLRKLVKELEILD
ncbi:hypothetical protein K488DRAFT_71978 [Vararia minispora EC-137]|uniref:Uncharacterized protein n=1 Tax=Vararia minispora EC-137 TaxID=1314806 RepID=A0ACB8QG69_9AGAM|nr:hypothetical protein K488DRAFT_71978 [Vararia minispora EC-137]